MPSTLMSLFPFLAACIAGALALALARRLCAGSSAADACLALRETCTRGRLETAQWRLAAHFSLTPADARADGNRALYLACEHGHLETAQRLVTYFGLEAANARAYDNYVLRVACANGHLEVAQWLAAHFGLTAADARANYNYALHMACKNGHREVARWVANAAEYSVEELAAQERHWRHLLPDLAEEVQALGPKSSCFGAQ